MEYPQTQDYSVFQEEGALVEHASQGQRIANFIIDLIVVYIVCFATGMIMALLSSGFREMAADSDADPVAKLMVNLFALLVLLFTYALIEGLTKGKTLGKLITKTRAVCEDGSPIGWKQAFGRSLVRLIPFEPFSGFTGHPWHDRLTKTTVVRERK